MWGGQQGIKVGRAWLLVECVRPNVRYNVLVHSKEYRLHYKPSR